MDAAETAWIAGIIEGEGSIALPARGGVALVVAMTDRDVIERVARVAGIGKMADRPLPPARPGYKPQWRWGAYRGADLLPFLLAIRPWMGDRRRERLDQAVARLDTMVQRRPYRRGPEAPLDRLERLRASIARAVPALA